MKNGFRVRPVSTYSGARYPSTWYQSSPDEEEPKQFHPLQVLLALVLVMVWLSIRALTASRFSERCSPVANSGRACISMSSRDSHSFVQR